MSPVPRGFTIPFVPQNTNLWITKRASYWSIIRIEFFQGDLPGAEMTVLAELEDYRSSSIGALEGRVAAIPLDGGSVIIWDWETQRGLRVVDPTARELLAVSALVSHPSRKPLTGSRLIHTSS